MVHWRIWLWLGAHDWLSWAHDWLARILRILWVAWIASWITSWVTWFARITSILWVLFVLCFVWIVVIRVVPPMGLPCPLIRIAVDGHLTDALHEAWPDDSTWLVGSHAGRLAIDEAWLWAQHNGMDWLRDA